MNRENGTTTGNCLASPDFYEVFFNSIFVNNQTPMLIIHPDTYKIEDCNESACLFYKYSKDQLIQLNLTDICILTEEEVAYEMQLSNTEQRNYVFKHKRSNQEIIDVEVMCTPIVMQDKILLLSSITNRRIVNERLRAINTTMEDNIIECTYQWKEVNTKLEEMNAESNALLVEEINEKTEFTRSLQNEFNLRSTILENLQDGVVVCDTEGTLLLFNKRLREWHGMDAMKLPQSEWSQYYSLYQKDGKTLFEIGEIPLVRALGGEVFRGVEMVIAAKDQTLRHLSAYGSPFFDGSGKKLGAVCVLQDITGRIKAEEQLRESKEKYRVLYETAGVGIGFYKLDGTILSYNVLAARHMGGTPSDFEGKSIYDVFPMQADFYMDRIRQAAASNNRLEFEDEVFLTTGVMWFLSTFTKIIDKANQVMGVQIISQDITRLKQTQIALIESKKQMQWSQRLAKLGYWEWNIQTNEAYWSDIILEIYGRTESDGIPAFENWMNTIHPDDRETLADNINKTLAGEQTYDAEYRVIRKDSGEIRYVHTTGEVVSDETGKPHKLMGIIQDITERKIIEEELKESENQLQKVVDEAPIPIMLYAEDGEVIKISNAWTEMTGYAHEDIPTTEIWAEMAYGVKYEEVYAAITALSRIDHQQNDGEFIVSTKNGEKLIWDFYSASIGKLSDNRRLTMSVAIDVTERKNSEMKLQLAKEEAEAASIAKSEFLANMSHEIRTPLNGLMGMLQLLQMTGLTEEQLEYIKISRTSSECLLKVINDILDYSKIESGNMKIEKQPFGIKEFIQDVNMLFLPSAQKKGLVLEDHIQEGIPDRLIGDPFRLRQILSNMIGNAIKFTHQGRIDVTVRKVEEMFNHNVKLEFQIEDTGIGIQKDKTNEIFQGFHQADSSTTRQYGGTGLGLTISKSLVEKMKGEIWVKSTEGVGSSFFFTCVLGRNENENTADDKATQNIQESIKEDLLKILIVEDDDISRMVIEKFAKQKGWQTVVAKNGKEAVEAYQESIFDAIAMDMQMPVLDGYQATGIIRHYEQKYGLFTPIIAMTAYALKGDKERCLKSGLNDYLSKPIVANDFYSVIERWVKKGDKS